MDRIEKEINDLLEKLDSFPGEEEARAAAAPRPAAPIRLEQRRATKAAAARPRPSVSRLIDRVNPPFVMLTGAAMVIGGLVLSAITNALIWVSFSGVVVFLAAFLISFRRTPVSRGKAGGGDGNRAVFWRDRYIQYEPPTPGLGKRVKRFFRRR